MKRLILLPLLLLTLSLGATKVYVATTGNDGTGDGTIGAPYLTIATGIINASSGDTVFVVAGTYNVTTQMAVGTGISIVNDTGTKPVIASSSAINAIFLLSSASEGTNGNQSISGLRFTGGDAVDYGVQIIARSNVLLHDCEFDGFERYAIQNRGGTSGGTGRPVTWATGNRIYSNTITDCGFDEYDTPNTTWLVYGGGIEIAGQSGPLVYDNNINNALGYGGGIRSIADSGFVRGAKIYDNTIRCGYRDSVSQTSYSFSIELWTGKGGNEIYRNNCNGSIDCGGYGWDDTGGYGFALRVYDNTIILDTMPTNSEEAGLLFESGCIGGVSFMRNFVKNFSKGLVFSLTENSLVQGINGFYVNYNIFSNIGRVSGSITGTGMDYNMVRINPDYMPDINDFRIYNNVFYRGGTVRQTYGLNFVAKDATSGVGASWTNVSVVNNLTYNVYTPCKWDDQVLDTVNIQNNVSYSALNNARFNTCDTAIVTLEAFGTADPLFKSNETFRLRPTSTCVDAGLDVDLTTDYHGHRVPQNGTPDIGAAEYGNYVLFYNGKQLY